jgi:hypothetical protein
MVVKRAGSSQGRIRIGRRKSLCETADWLEKEGGNSWGLVSGRWQGWPDGMEWKEYLVGRTRTLYAIDPSERDMGQEPLKIAPNVLSMYSKRTPETPERPL